MPQAATYLIAGVSLACKRNTSRVVPLAFVGVAAHLDAASGLPLNPAGRTALLAALDQGWADPVRLYRDGRRAGQLLHAARESIAGSLGVRPAEILFDTGLESALSHTLTALARGRASHGKQVAFSAVEHSALWHSAARAGLEVTSCPVDRTGKVDPEAFTAAAQGAAVAVLQSANHEVGTRQPVTRVAQALPDVPLIVDAHQSVGRDELPQGWSALVASAKHWGGPAGVGVIAAKTSAMWSPERPNDGREFGRITGVPNVPAIVAAAAALEDVLRTQHESASRTRILVDRIRSAVPELIADVEVVGDPIDRLPHIVTFSCLYVDGEALLHALDRAGIAVSSGSACTSDVLTPSHVLVAMGVLSQGNVRVSLPFDVTDDAIDHFLKVLPQAVSTVREQLGARGI